jgi:hypothetical protein
MDTSTAQGNVEMHDIVTEELISARRLWLAVILNAVEDGRNGTLRACREAQEFLFETMKISRWSVPLQDWILPISALAC